MSFLRSHCWFPQDITVQLHLDITVLEESVIVHVAVCIGLSVRAAPVGVAAHHAGLLLFLLTAPLRVMSMSYRT